MPDSYLVPNLSSGQTIDGDVVRLIRVRENRSLRAIAAQAGISPSELSKIETGQRGASTTYLVTKLAAVLRVPACVITVAR